MEPLSNIFRQVVDLSFRYTDLKKTSGLLFYAAGRQSFSLGGGGYLSLCGVVDDV